MQSVVRVLVVDDSAVFRTILKTKLEQTPGIQVVGAAEDAYQARDLIVKKKPDVITLDLEMPKMNGLEFIQVLMEHWPIPIVVVSSYLSGDEKLGLKAIEYGAMALFEKPSAGRFEEQFLELSKLVMSLKGKKPRKKAPQGLSPIERLLNPAADRVIAIGASTGGTEAIKEVLMRMPGNCPGILLVQHMPEGFTQSYAMRLNDTCKQLTVKEAVHGDLVLPGTALLAPGDKHLYLKKSANGGYHVAVQKGQPVNRHMPSVDVTFESVAQVAGDKAVGALLTGMGADGAKGLLAMRKAGARTIAQDEATSVVFGMPKEALAIGGAERAVPLEQVAATLISLLKK